MIIHNTQLIQDTTHKPAQRRHWTTATIAAEQLIHGTAGSQSLVALGGNGGFAVTQLPAEVAGVTAKKPTTLSTTTVNQADDNIVFSALQMHAGRSYV